MRSSIPTPPRSNRERALLRRLLVGGLAAAVVLAVGVARAAELRGRVTTVTGRDVRIQLEGDLLPRVGDPVKLAFRLPNGPEVSVVGAWRVTAIEGDLVLATPVGEGSTPAVGHAAKIDSPSPAPRSGAPQPSTALAPGAPGAPRAPGPASPPTESGVAPGSRPWPGVSIRSLAPGIAKQLGAPTTLRDVLVQAVPGRSGLIPFDVIVRFDGAPVRDAADLQRRVAATPVGATVEVVVIRDGAERVLQVTVGARPPADQAIDLSGEWVCEEHCLAGGAGKIARIVQHGIDLDLRNEDGHTSRGKVLSAGEIVAGQWNNLRATVTDGGNTIRWANGTIWRRR